MEKDLGKIKKNEETEIIVRVDDFGGRPGLTIREFVRSERYTGFTKSGTRIPAENFDAFKQMINSVDPADFKTAESSAEQGAPASAPAQNADTVDESELL